MTKMTDKEQQLYDTLMGSVEVQSANLDRPREADDVDSWKPGFRVSRVWMKPEPHTYCIGSKHVVYASEHCSGILDEGAILAAEKHGAGCEYWGTGSNRCTLSYSRHTHHPALVVVVKDRAAQMDLNSVPGLHAYLLAIKGKCEELGITGFAFPNEMQEGE